MELKTGSQTGIDRLFRRYYKPLVVFADAYLRHLPDAEDLVQEQLIKLWERSPWKDLNCHTLGSYLFTVVKNASVNALERKKILTRSLDMPHFQVALQEAEEMTDDRAFHIRHRLGELPEKTRLVVERVMLEDKMYKEAAQELNVSVNTVKTLLRAGIKQLREHCSNRSNLSLFLLFKRNLIHFR